MTVTVRENLIAGLRGPTFEATEKQAELVEATLSGDYLYLAMGGGIRGTKTWGVLSLVVILCRIYPGSRWAIVRKDLPTLRRNTIPSFNKLRDRCHGFVDDLNQGTWSYRCANGSEIIMFPESFKTDPELERWRGLEVNGFVLEEANELQQASANKAIERAGAWIIPSMPGDPEPEQPPPYVFFTFNPCDNWPRQWFYEPFMAGTLSKPYFYLPSTAADNPYIPDAVRKAWKNLPKAEYERFVEGNWQSITEPNQLIHSEWIWNAKNVEHVPGENRLGVDVARYGDDETVLARVNGNMLLCFDAYEQKSTEETARIVQKEITGENPINAPNVTVDGVGLGAGTVDVLRARRFKVRDFIGGAKPINRRIKAPKPIGYGGMPPKKPGDTHRSLLRFKNRRAQAYWEAREALRKGEHSINPDIPDEQMARLVADLTAIEYDIDSERVLSITSKDDLKLDNGRSPDYGDSYVMAHFNWERRFKRSELPPSKSQITL